jgi:hypothetical protein
MSARALADLAFPVGGGDLFVFARLHVAEYLASFSSHIVLRRQKLLGFCGHDKQEWLQIERLSGRPDIAYPAGRK